MSSVGEVNDAVTARLTTQDKGKRFQGFSLWRAAVYGLIAALLIIGAIVIAVVFMAMNGWFDGAPQPKSLFNVELSDGRTLQIEAVDAPSADAAAQCFIDEEYGTKSAHEAETKCVGVKVR